SRRLQTPIHTGMYSIVDMSERPPKLKVRLTQKLNFGFLKIVVDGKSSTLNETEQALHEEQFAGMMPRFRAINGPGNNGYEKWLTAFMCTDDIRDHRMLAFKHSNPSTGIKDPTVATSVLEAAPLYKKRAGHTFQQPGIERTLVIRNYDVGEQYCLSGLSNFTTVQGQPGFDGNFFTDPNGVVAHADPDEHRIHQYVEPGFSYKVQGKHVLKMVDHFSTYYGKPGKDGIDRNEMIWDAIDPK
ncbi:MAG: hypothetical protein SGILL_008152, partial [Bacillariaceae sp.]